MGISLATLPLIILVMGIPFVGLWFLGDFLFIIHLAWFAIIIRIMQWAIGAMMAGCLIYWIYSFFKGIVTGKDIYE